MRALFYASILFAAAILAALLGIGGIAAGAAEIARILLFVFLIMAAVMLVLGLVGGREE